MTSEKNKSIPDDEIDFGFIGSKMVSLFSYPFRLIFSNLKISLWFFLFAMALSVSLKFIIPKSYKSGFIICPNNKNEKFHLQIINDIYTLWKLDDNKSLSRELKIEESVVKSINKLSVLNYSTKKIKGDTSNTTEITLEVGDVKNLLPLQNAILRYLEEAPYFSKITALQKSNIALKAELINKDLILLDSLKHLQLSTYDRLRITEQNSVYLKDIINPTATYTLALERIHQKTNLLSQLAFINNFELVKGIVIPEKHFAPPRILIMALVIVPVFMLLCVIYLHFRARN